MKFRRHTPEEKRIMVELLLILVVLLVQYTMLLIRKPTNIIKNMWLVSEIRPSREKGGE